MLDFARGDSGRFTFEPWSRLDPEACCCWRPIERLQAAGSQIGCDAGTSHLRLSPLAMDRRSIAERVQQCLAALVDNALRVLAQGPVELALSPIP